MRSTVGCVVGLDSEELAELAICKSIPNSKFARKINIRTLDYDVICGMDRLRIKGLGVHAECIRCGAGPAGDDDEFGGCGDGDGGDENGGDASDDVDYNELWDRNTKSQGSKPLSLGAPT